MKTILKSTQFYYPTVGQTETFYLDGLELDPKSREVTLNKQQLLLTPKEFDLLNLLSQHPNQVLSKEQIYEQVWQEPAIGDLATVIVHVKRLRLKIEKINPLESYKNAQRYRL